MATLKAEPTRQRTPTSLTCFKRKRLAQQQRRGGPRRPQRTRTKRSPAPASEPWTSKVLCVSCIVFSHSSNGDVLLLLWKSNSSCWMRLHGKRIWVQVIPEPWFLNFRNYTKFAGPIKWVTKFLHFLGLARLHPVDGERELVRITSSKKKKKKVLYWSSVTVYY